MSKIHDNKIRDPERVILYCLLLVLSLCLPRKYRMKEYVLPKTEILIHELKTS